LMLAKVWRNNKFTGHQGRMLGNNGGSLCKVCRLVRLTTSRGESLLKVCEKISVGWIVQSSSSFEMIIVMASIAQSGGSAPKEASAVRFASLMWNDPRDQVLLRHH
jgi:hypothetical protein